MFRVAYQFRLAPTKGQVRLLEQVLATCRWLYNDTLAYRKAAWEEEQRTADWYETKRRIPILKAERPSLKAVHSQVLQNVTERVDLAFKAFFRRVKAGETPGYPRFRGKGWYDSFTYPQADAFRVDGQWLDLSKIGRVQMIDHRPTSGTIKTLTIRRASTGKWFACFSVETDPEPLPETHRAVGIDVGLEKFATLSTGEQIANPRFFRNDEQALAKAQRRLSKADKATPERAKRRKVAAHIHERIANRRKDFAHKLSRRLVNEFGIIVLEDLNIARMIKNHSLAKSIADAAWNQFASYTRYKAESAGRTYVQIDPRGTSQRCSRCSSVVKKALSERVHQCPCCGLKIDRYLPDARALRLPTLVAAIAGREHLVNDVDHAIVEQWTTYFLLKGYLSGLTLIREYLATIERRVQPEVRYFQCKLYNENSLDTVSLDEQVALQRLFDQLNLQMSPDTVARYSRKGEFLQADTLLLLRLSHQFRILAVDVSIFLVRALRDLRDLQNVEVLRQMLRSEVSYLRSKSVFAELTIDTATLDLPFPDALRRYFRAFLRRDKESAKLIQAASYADSLYGFALDHALLAPEDDVLFNVVGYSDRGINTLAATGAQRNILQTCAEIYKHQPTEQDSAAAQRDVVAAITSNAARCFGAPGEGRAFLSTLLGRAADGGDEPVAVRFSEHISGFVNTSDPPPADVLDALHLADVPTLRDAHGALITRALAPEAAETVVFLTGNPGIGKTTAIIDSLKAHMDDGFLFVYASPRKQVNLDVVEKFGGMEAGTLCDDRLLSLNTNADIIRDHGGRPTVQYRANARRGDFDARGVQFIDERSDQARRAMGSSRLKRATESEIQDTGMRQSGVLHSICTALGAVMSGELAPAVVATVSIQALKKTRRGDTLDHFKAIFKDAYNERTNQVVPAKLRSLAGRMRHLFIMIDEVTGDESGVEFLDRILGVLQQLQLTDRAHGFNTKVIVADASIVDPGVITQHLSSREPERDKIFFRKLHAPAAPLSYDQMRFKRHSAAVINTNSYPATALDLHYTVLMETVLYSERSMLAGNRRLLQRVQTELVTDLLRLLGDPAAGQVIVYLQDKRRLEALVDTLRASLGSFEAGTDYAEIHADLSDAQKRDLLRYKDRVRLVLMTASASRGLSFPNTRHLLVVVPGFDIEHNLMEIIQVLYRGRGGPLERSSKAVRFYLADRIVVDPRDPDRRVAAEERALNLINLLVILKTSIMTRIQGYGIVGRDKCLMIPIGGKAVHAAGESVSNQLATVIKDLEKEHLKHPNRNLGRLADRLASLLGRSEVLVDPGMARDLSEQSFLRLMQTVDASVLTPLRTGLHTLLDLPPLEPAHLSGSLLIVPMRDRRVQERYEMRLWEELDAFRSPGLLRAMREVAYSDGAYPERLRSGMRQALDLVQLVEAAGVRITQRLEHAGERGDQYYAVPLWALISREALSAYFASDAVEPEDETFRDLLALYARTLYPVDGILPIGRRYGSFPFVVFRSYSLNELRQKLFTDRHLLTSQELSVLNLMLASG